MKSHRIILGATALFMAVSGLHARQLTVDEAIAAAGSAVRTMSGPTASETYTVAERGINTVYVLPGATGGYVVLAADDLAPAVLGYSDNGVFDPDNIPPAMQGWLNQYSGMIAYAAEHNIRIVSAPANPALTDIAPITKTRWNQDAPYNDLCPRVEYDGQQLPTYTGCVATAVAQVMKTYAYPTTGTGTYSYNWNNRILSFDYGSTTFDWANMTDTYGPESTQTQKDAVATLMYAIGVSCDMGYGTGGSGSRGIAAAMGLVRNFGYDHSAAYLGRNYFTLPKWSEMLHSELSQGHPVYYDGANQSVGHAFVIDGYRSADGFFHVNWGWGGISNGYFSIVTLDPDAQGIGGSTEGYFLGQSAIFGLKPAQEGSQITPVFVCEGLLDNTRTYERNESVQISNGVYNTSLGNVTAELGLRLTPAAGGEDICIWSEYGPVDIDYGYGFRYFPVSGKEFPEGNYSAIPIVRCGNDIRPILCYIDEVTSINVTVTSDAITLSPVSISCNISRGDVELLSPFYRNRPAVLRTTVTNNGPDEYYGIVEARLRSAKGNILSLGYSVTDLLDGESETLTFSGKLSFAYPLGEAYVEILDGEGNIMGDPVPVEVKTTPSGTPEISIFGINAPEASAGDGSYENPYVVDPSRIIIEARLSNRTGYFYNSIRAYVFKPQGGSSSLYLQAPMTPVDAGQTKELIFTGDLSSSLETGQTYMINFAEVGTNSIEIVKNAPVVYFTTSNNTGINSTAVTGFSVYPNPAVTSATVTAPSPISSVSIFDLAGACRASMDCDGETTATVRTDNIAPGHYFLRVNTTDGTAATLRLIKR